MSQFSTLDIYHQKIINDIEENSAKIDELQAELEKHESIISEFIAHKNNEHGNEDVLNSPSISIDNYINALDKRIEITEKINDLKKNSDENKYFTDTGDILFKYYDLIENGKGNISSDPSADNGIMKYFKSNSKKSLEVTGQTSSETSTATVTRVSKENIEKTRGNLLNDYMYFIDKNYKDTTKKLSVDDVCSHCGSDNFVVMTHDGYRYCNDCYTMDNLIVDHDKPSYKDPPKEITYFSYKRINHLNEWLNQIQGKETTDIPDEIYERILLEIKKQRITNMAELTNDRIKAILKHMKVHKYYEHIPHIMYRLNGLPMPNFSSELEDKLRTMFKQIQTPFLKHSPARRKNFLSYSYVLHKFLQLLEKDEYLSYFPLLKSRDKLSSQDAIWKLICNDVGWEYIPSL